MAYTRSRILIERIRHEPDRLYAVYVEHDTGERENAHPDAFGEVHEAFEAARCLASARQRLECVVIGHRLGAA